MLPQEHIAPVALRFIWSKLEVHQPGVRIMLPVKYLIKTAATLGLAIMLSGCVIYPAWGPYYHPHHWDR
jgi:hypothetical protein